MIGKLLYKAKDVATGEWIVGYPVVKTDSLLGTLNYFILCQEHDVNGMLNSMVTWYRIDPSTLCHCIGHCDKNGEAIFENDYVRTEFGRTCKVIWFVSPTHCGWDLEPIDFDAPPPSKYSLWASRNLEVCGNEFDAL